MTAPIVSRVQAGLAPPDGTLSKKIDFTQDTLHHGGDSVWHGTIGDHARCASIWRAWQEFHQKVRGWVDIAYNGGCCPHGFIFVGRWMGLRSAAQGTNDGNLHSAAWVYIGGLGDPFTDAAKSAFLDVLAMSREYHNNAADAPVRPHNYWHPTACPEDQIEGWIKAGLPDPHLTWSPPAPVHLNAPVVSVEATPTGRGYWMAAEDGGVFTFGDAMFWGSLGGVHLNAPIVEIIGSPSGGGYALIAADGGVFTFGDFRFVGSLGGTHLNAPIVGAEASDSGGGYILVGSDGGAFTFGDVAFAGSVQG